MGAVFNSFAIRHETSPESLAFMSSDTRDGQRISNSAADILDITLLLKEISRMHILQAHSISQVIESCHNMVSQGPTS